MIYINWNLKDHNLFEFWVFLQWLYCTTVSARVGELMGARLICVCLFVFLISPKSSPHLQLYSCASKKSRWRVSPLTCSLAITITWTLPHALSLQAQPLHILEIHAHYWKQALHRQTYCKQSCLNKMVSGDWALGGFGLCPVTNESHAWSDSSFCPATTWMDLVW